MRNMIKHFCNLKTENRRFSAFSDTDVRLVDEVHNIAE